MIGRYLLIFSILLLSSCSQSFKGTVSSGDRFPTVDARSLAGEEVSIPEVFAEAGDTLLLVGFVQDSQFDIDRWILGLKQLKTPVVIAEIPAAVGFVPRLLSEKIDQGMRDGIPEEDWSIVFTVYDDAEKIASFLGNEKPRNARAVLIDSAGEILWTHDRGYSADKVLELDNLIRKRKS